MALDLFCCFFSAQAEALVQLNWIDLLIYFLVMMISLPVKNFLEKIFRGVFHLGGENLGQYLGLRSIKKATLV